MPYPDWQALTPFLFSIIKIGMATKRYLAGFLTLLLAACTLNPAPLAPTGTSSPTLPPGVTPSITASPTFTPSPTPTSEARVATADQEFFDGDYTQAQSEYQIALSNTTDSGIQAAALWGLGRV